MSDLKIERDKKYKLRSGTVARVLATDMEGPYPVVAAYTGEEAGRSYLIVVNLDSDGRSDSDGQYDIVAEYREPRTFYINFYGDGSNCAFNTEAEAKSSANTIFAEQIAVPFREVL